MIAVYPYDHYAAFLSFSGHLNSAPDAYKGQGLLVSMSNLPGLSYSLRGPEIRLDLGVQCKTVAVNLDRPNDLYAHGDQVQLTRKVSFMVYTCVTHPDRSGNGSRRNPARSIIHLGDASCSACLQTLAPTGSPSRMVVSSLPSTAARSFSARSLARCTASGPSYNREASSIVQPRVSRKKNQAKTMRKICIPVKTK